MSSQCEATVETAAGAHGTAVLHLRGEIDGNAKTLLPQAYSEAIAVNDPAEVRIDFTRVDYINSTGIAVIVGVLARARSERREISAVGLTDHYKHIFTITRLVDFIRMVEPADAVSTPSSEQR